MIHAGYDINALNRDFGVPGRIAFREGPPGEPVAVLVEEHGSCEVSFYGAHVLSYRPTGHSPVLWLAKSYRELPDGSAIRGGIPVCWPWFGPREGMPSHGFARTARWNLLKTDYDSHSTSITLVLEDSAESLAMWPHKFRLELKVTLAEALVVSLSIENTGDAPFDITGALHSYFNVKEIGGICVKGLDGVKYLDRAPGGSDAIQDGDISIRSETDRIYVSAPDEADIEDRTLGRTIKVVKEGATDVVVWNPWIEKAARLADMDDDDFLRFVCVETAFTSPITLAPGQNRRVRAAIAAEYPRRALGDK